MSFYSAFLLLLISFCDMTLKFNSFLFIFYTMIKKKKKLQETILYLPLDFQYQECEIRHTPRKYNVKQHSAQ